MPDYGRFAARLAPLAAALSLSAVASAAPPAPSTAPVRGVVLVVVDTLRADRVGALGLGRGTRTPALDAYARGCAAFSAARSHAPWTLPSMASLLTSLHPSRHGLLNRYRDFTAEPLTPARLEEGRPGARTLAQTLRAAGWRTAAFTGGGGLADDAGLEAGFEVFDASPTFSGFERTVPRALRWLDGLEPGERFLLLVHGYDAHPSHPGRLAQDLRERHKALRALGLEGKTAPSDPALRKRLTDSYDWGVESMDRRLARLLKRLRGSSMDGVLVAITADHGEELFERGGVDHGMTLHDELLRVPLLICGPGVAARRVDAPVRLVDVMPTLLEAAGVSPDARLAAQLDGVSLRPLWEGRELALDSFAETDFLLSASLRSVVTSDGWKAVLDRAGGRLSLYKLAEDPRELTDASREHPRLAASLRRRLEAAGPGGEESAGARRGPWKALRRGGRLELYDLRVDPYLREDVSQREAGAALELAGELARPADGSFQPSEEMRRKLREAGYW